MTNWLITVLCFLKKLYKQMENRIDSAIEMGEIPKEIRDQHRIFRMELQSNKARSPDNCEGNSRILPKKFHDTPF